MRNGNQLSKLNISSTPLGSNETFTGEWEDCRLFSSVVFAVKTDAKCTLYVDFSDSLTDAITESTLTYKIAANINEVHRLTITRPFFRLRLVNGTTAQTALNISVIFGEHTELCAPMNLSLGLDSDATTVRPTSFEDEVVIGRRAGITPFTKFSYRTSLQAVNGDETIWNRSGNFTPQTEAETYTITYNNVSDGEGNNGALSLVIYYLDSDGLPAVGTHTLGNTGSDVTSFSGWGINRVAVLSAGSTQVNSGAIYFAGTTSGTDQAFIAAGEGTTQQAIYHVGWDSVAVAKYLRIKVNKISGGGNPKVIIKGWVFSRVTNCKYLIFRESIDTSIDTTISINEPVGFKLNNKDILYFTADTDTNNTNCTCRFSLLEYERA